MNISGSDELGYGNSAKCFSTKKIFKQFAKFSPTKETVFPVLNFPVEIKAYFGLFLLWLHTMIRDNESHVIAHLHVHTGTSSLFRACSGSAQLYHELGLSSLRSLVFRVCACACSTVHTYLHVEELEISSLWNSHLKKRACVR